MSLKLRTKWQKEATDVPYCESRRTRVSLVSLDSHPWLPLHDDNTAKLRTKHQVKQPATTHERVRLTLGPGIPCRPWNRTFMWVSDCQMYQMVNWWKNSPWFLVLLEGQAGQEDPAEKSSEPEEEETPSKNAATRNNTTIKTVHKKWLESLNKIIKVDGAKTVIVFILRRSDFLLHWCDGYVTWVDSADYLNPSCSGYIFCWMKILCAMSLWL